MQIQELKQSYSTLVNDINQYIGESHVVEIKTSNLNSVRLDNTKVEANKPIMSYHADDEFNDRYGPFEKVEDIDLTKMTFNESGKSELRSTMRIIKLPNGGLQYIT